MTAGSRRLAEVPVGIDPPVDAEALASLRSIENLTVEIFRNAEALSRMWHEESNEALQHLQTAWAELQSLDFKLDSLATDSDFNLIRMAQSVTENLHRKLEAEPKVITAAWFTEAVQTIGNAAVMLIGSWGNTWWHDTRWRLAAEVGTASAIGADATADFGGALPPVAAVNMAESKLRVWGPFRKEAQAWLDRFDAEVASAVEGLRRLDSNESLLPVSNASSNKSGEASAPSTISTTTEASTTSASPTAAAGVPAHLDQNLIELVGLVQALLPFVETLTERFLEPLSRPGAKLLAGPLPKVLVYDARGSFLTDALAVLSEDVAITDAWYGFGTQAMRPWVEVSSEITRIQRASAEFVALSRGRMAMLQRVIPAILDAREVNYEPVVVAAASRHALYATQHVRAVLDDDGLSTISSASQGSAAGGWRWLELTNALVMAQLIGEESASRLCRRRLVKLERLAEWLGDSQEAAILEYRATWKRQWPAGSSSKWLKDSEDAAINEIDRALAKMISDDTREGYLRVEFGEDEMPLSFASLRSNGQIIFRLRSPPGVSNVRMHREVHAVMTTPNVEWTPLFPIDCPTSVTSCVVVGEYTDPLNSTIVAAFGPHVELRLRHLSGSSLGPPHPAQPFGTRHERRSCNTLSPVEGGAGSGDGVGAALLPMDGLWELTLRDGRNGRLLRVEEGATLRLMFRVNVPSSPDPWKFFADHPKDVLYEMPDNGDCSGLQTIFGQEVVYSTTRRTYAPASSTGPTTAERIGTTSDAKHVWISTTTSDDSIATTPASPSASSFLAPKTEDSDDRGFFLDGVPLMYWLLPLGFGIAVMASCVISMIYFYWKRRRLRALIKNGSNHDDAKFTNSEEADEEKLDPEFQVQPPPNLVIPPAWCLAGSVGPWKDTKQCGQDLEDWTTSATPRRSSAQAASDSGGDSDCGVDAATPEGNSPRSSVGSSSYSSSSYTSSDLPSEKNLRTASVASPRGVSASPSPPSQVAAQAAPPARLPPALPLLPSLPIAPSCSSAAADQSAHADSASFCADDGGDAPTMVASAVAMPLLPSLAGSHSVDDDDKDEPSAKTQPHGNLVVQPLAPPPALPAPPPTLPVLLDDAREGTSPRRNIAQDSDAARNDICGGSIVKSSERREVNDAAEAIAVDSSVSRLDRSCEADIPDGASLGAGRRGDVDVPDGTSPSHGKSAEAGTPASAEPKSGQDGSGSLYDDTRATIPDAPCAVGADEPEGLSSDDDVDSDDNQPVQAAPMSETPPLAATPPLPLLEPPVSVHKNLDEYSDFDSGDDKF
jgi:hypothetical protein